LAIAADALELLEKDEAILVTVLPLAGVKPDDDDVCSENVRIRPLTSDEIGAQFAMLGGSEPRAYARKAQVSFSVPEFAAYALEVRERGPKTGQIIGTDLAKRMILALQLLGHEPFGRGHATSWREPGPSPGISGILIQLAQNGDERNCSVEQLTHARELAERMPHDVFAGAAHRNSIALHRFYLGSIDPSPADAIIDFSIALETILLQEQGSELALRFRLYGAYFLAPHDAVTRQEVFQQFHEIYRLRSEIVHGGARSPIQALTSVRAQARALAAQVLTKGIDHGWPTPESLMDALIKGGSRGD
jgi:Apea-like HEPN